MGLFRFNNLLDYRKSARLSRYRYTHRIVVITLFTILIKVNWNMVLVSTKFHFAPLYQRPLIFEIFIVKVTLWYLKECINREVFLSTSDIKAKRGVRDKKTASILLHTALITTNIFLLFGLTLQISLIQTEDTKSIEFWNFAVSESPENVACLSNYPNSS